MYRLEVERFDRSRKKRSRSQSSLNSPDRKKSPSKKKRRRSRSSSSSSCERRKKKKKKESGKMKKKNHTYSSESTDSSDSEKKTRKKKKQKRKKKNKKKKSHKKEKSQTDKVATTHAQLSDATKIKQPTIQATPVISNTSSSVPSVPKRRAMVPMTKEEYDKQQSIVRRVYDPDTGRNRLVKGDGEILEEIVSLARHKEINKMSTKQDGLSFAASIGLLRK
ncbi:ADP-ribosylation factor-like protein 6-interacting protein 4 [Hydractinia symbiolongicarpus]|uniref:ADP-ribosylation factor-like protein 6-interacting protein 4 n=1 Tax=Hydractinia symbiolongicarpus TaxID=13093 RepID=UPI00255112A5|nr:ADP-ribosylation factor-like protein 6-interacting protein 4 [Hydractinia symbiolongicarpus]